MKQGKSKSLKLSFFKACVGAAFVTSIFNVAAVSDANAYFAGGFNTVYQTTNMQTAMSGMDDDGPARQSKHYLTSEVIAALENPDTTVKELVGLGYPRGFAEYVPECREDMAGAPLDGLEVHDCAKSSSYWSGVGKRTALAVVMFGGIGLWIRRKFRQMEAEIREEQKKKAARKDQFKDLSAELARNAVERANKRNKKQNNKGPAPKI